MCEILFMCIYMEPISNTVFTWQTEQRVFCRLHTKYCMFFQDTFFSFRVPSFILEVTAKTTIRLMSSCYNLFIHAPNNLQIATRHKGWSHLLGDVKKGSGEMPSGLFTVSEMTPLNKENPWASKRGFQNSSNYVIGFLWLLWTVLILQQTIVSCSHFSLQA